MLTAPVELSYTTNSPGRSQDFSKGGHTESYIGYSPDCHLNIVRCFLTKRLINGERGGHGHPRIPPGYALDSRDSKTVSVLGL